MSCPICLLRIKSPVCCPAGHVFCGACFDSWKSASQKVACPACRVDLSNGVTRLIGGNGVEDEVGVENVSSEELENRRRLRRVRALTALDGYESENRAWESAYRKATNELLEARSRIVELEARLAARTREQEPSPPSTLPVSAVTTPTKPKPKASPFSVKLTFKGAKTEGPPMKRLRLLDEEDEREQRDTAEIISALQSEIERLESANSRYFDLGLSSKLPRLTPSFFQASEANCNKPRRPPQNGRHMNSHPRNNESVISKRNSKSRERRWMLQMIIPRG